MIATMNANREARRIGAKQIDNALGIAPEVPWDKTNGDSTAKVIDQPSEAAKAHEAIARFEVRIINNNVGKTDVCLPAR